jgi:thymidylate synthase (FAD)
MAKVELITITPDAEKIIELCGRRCYNSIDKITDNSHVKFLSSALRRGHFSLLSFAHAVFNISEVSRVFSHQMVRHAHLRYLQRSQRYCDESNEAFVTPEMEGTASIFATCANASVLYSATVKDTFLAYKNLKFSGMKQEDARYVLPNACYTKMSVSGTLQGWWDFLRLRLGKNAQDEIRGVAKQIYAILNVYCPNIFNEELLLVQPKLNLEFPE